MQGQSFISGAAAGFLGSLGAAGWGEMVGSKFAGSAVGQISFGALSGGIGAELTGGNFWQGALAGGMVAGLNHAMHSIDSPFADDGDGGGKRRSTGENRDARHHKPAPKDLDGFPDAERVPNKGRARWKNPDGKILVVS